MNIQQIYEWIESQKLQIEQSETQEYEMVYLCDLPKLLENYYQMRIKENIVGYIPNKFSNNNKHDYGTPPKENHG